MSTPDLVRTLVASTLAIPVHSVTDTLAFNEIPQWDSLNHVNLMVALEQALAVEIDEEEMVTLTSVGAIREFVARRGDSRT
jgi:citrate synthase